MDVLELISKHGVGDIQLQNLDQASISLDYHHKKGTTITFGTTMSLIPNEGTQRLGLVIWLDRKKVEEILK